MRRWLPFAALFVVLVAQANGNAAEIGWQAAGKGGAVAAGRKRAVAAGILILEQGGNAADAAVATLLALSVTDYGSYAIGAEIPLMIYNAKTSEVKVLCGLGGAPLDPKAIDWYYKNGIPSTGSLKAAPVPGAVSLCMTTLKLYGTMRFEQVVAPTLELLDHGKQDWHKNLAATFRKLVETEKETTGTRDEKIQAARDRFYKGDIADALVAFYEREGGFLTKKDLAAHVTRVEDPVTVQYRGYTVCKCGPWTQGPYLCQTLRLLEGFDLKAMGHLSTDYIHAVTEALKLGLADRDEYYGDPLFVKVPLQALLSDPYTKLRRSLIDMKRASTEIRPGDPINMKPLKKGGGKSRPGPGGTTTCVVADRWGNLVAATPSGNGPYAVCEELGVAHGNRLRSLNTTLGHPNRIEPGKRPRITLTPTIVLKDGKGVIAISVAGGDLQDQTTLNCLLNHVEFGMMPKDAVTAPRFNTGHHQDSFDPNPDRQKTLGTLAGLRLNSAIDEKVRVELAGRGHKVTTTSRPIAYPVMLCRDSDTGMIHAAGDPKARRHAAALEKVPADPSLLTLERIFSSKEFEGEKFGPARWLEDGTGYTTLEDSDGETTGKEIVRYDPATGRREVIVPVARLIPEGTTRPLRINNYTWSKDGKKLLIFTNSKRVWRTNTRGDYWLLDLADWRLRQLGGDGEPSTMMFAKFSPEGDRVAYVRKNNLFVQDLKKGRIKRLTKDGSETIVNGTSDWVYEEEFHLRDGFRWSPDGKRIAYWQFDTEGVRWFSLINYTDSLYPKITRFPYPKVGETNSACRVGVVSAKGGWTRWFKVPGDPRNHYIPKMEWAANSREVVLQQLNRLQNTNKVMLGDVRNGRVRTILTERDEAWVDVHDDMKWIDDGNSFTWVSERDGWRHVYRVSRAGDEVKLLTPGAFDVISVESIDEKGGWLYYIASPDNPAQRYLYRVSLDGSGKAERLTPANQPGSHSYQISKDSRWAFHTYSSFDSPPVIELVKLPEHRNVRTMVENAELREKLNALKRTPVEFFRVDIGDGVLLEGWCMKPPDFDPTKKYPLLFYVYGEPAGQTVRDAQGGRSETYLWHTMLTQKGYLVISVDNRGTRAPRGREWRKCIYRQIGILASADQAAATRAIIKSRPYVDPDRIGIWGWSGGGSMSLNAIFRYPDLYHTAMAIAFISNQRFYDTIYQERYMGLPDDNAEGFKNGSPITFAHQLKGNLLLVYGTGDDNCHYQNCQVLVNELIKHNKRFAMMAYPNRTHSIGEGKNTKRHLFETLTGYLMDNLPAGPRTAGP